MTTTPQFEVRRVRSVGYVIHQDGKKIYGPVQLPQAMEKLDSLHRAARIKTRKCLTCRTDFRSEGPHNRMCPNCRTRSYYDGAA